MGKQTVDVITLELIHSAGPQPRSSVFFRFEALHFDGFVELRAAERAPTGGQRIVRHILAVDGTRLGRVVALAVLQADGLHQLGRGPVNRSVVRQERTGIGWN